MFTLFFIHTRIFLVSVVYSSKPGRTHTNTHGCCCRFFWPAVTAVNRFRPLPCKTPSSVADVRPHHVYVTLIPHAHAHAHWSSFADPSIAGGLPQVGRSKSSGIRDHHVSRRHVEVTVPAEREEGSAEGARAAAPRSCLRQLPARATCYSFECTIHSIGVSYKHACTAAMVWHHICPPGFKCCI